MAWTKRSLIFQSLKSKYTNPDMRLTVNDNGDLVWQESGRLKDYPEVEGEEVVEINIRVPGQLQYAEHSITLESPFLQNYSQQVYSVMGSMPKIKTGRKNF